MSEIKVNSYFENNVKSMALENNEGVLTIGVMAIGQYVFGTSQREYMTVVSGALKIKLPNVSDWQWFQKGETFVIEANEKFEVVVEETTAYLCRYES